MTLDHNNGNTFKVSYVAYMVDSLEGHFRDTALQLCHGQNWQVHSCPFDEDRGQVIANIVSGQCVLGSITRFFPPLANLRSKGHQTLLCFHRNL